jgi:hypothetical protein
MCKTPTGIGTGECHWLRVTETVTRIGDGRRRNDVRNGLSHRQLVTADLDRPKARHQRAQERT